MEISLLLFQEMLQGVTNIMILAPTVNSTIALSDRHEKKTRMDGWIEYISQQLLSWH